MTVDSKHAPSILIVEDDPLQQKMLSTLLERKRDWSACTADNGRDALQILEDPGKGGSIRLVILDVDMPVMNGIDTLDILRQSHPHLPVIMLTGNKDIELAVKAMKLGATDFVMKPYEGDRLIVTVDNALKISLLSKEITRLQQEKDGTLTFESLIGHNGGLHSAVQIGRKAAHSDIPILVTGETGTGKELFSQALHGESHRAGKPFIAVNCGSIPSQLVESTLFGHEKGAFTGASEKAPGKFREAEGGTIFLDEIGELSPEAQVKLLRVLQQKEVEPVGSAHPVPVSVRVISATNRNLAEEVATGRFREDLYFRINVLQVTLPPLRDRCEDIPSLSQHFIEQFCALESRMPYVLSDSAQKFLQTREWPGNVRELENLLKRAMILSEDHILDCDDFLTAEANTKKSGLSPWPLDTACGFSLFSTDGSLKPMNQIEQEAMQHAVSHYNGNISQAAKAIGMAKSTFYRKTKHSVT